VPGERSRSDREAIPQASVRRLSLYLRYLEGLPQRDAAKISSRALGAAVGFGEAQVRKDLAHFGTFGSPGIGYRVADLAAALRRALGTDQTWDAILVGAGNLGRALASHRGFVSKGFRIRAAFDADPAKIGTSLGGAAPSDEPLIVRPIDSAAAFVAAHAIRLAILAVPAESAQVVTNDLVVAGIDGVLNFAPVRLAVPDHVVVNSVDLAAQLERIVFQLRPEQSGTPTS
jgi:redox-sensing transcriptional repressor